MELTERVSKLEAEAAAASAAASAVLRSTKFWLLLTPSVRALVDPGGHRAKDGK